MLRRRIFPSAQCYCASSSSSSFIHSFPCFSSSSSSLSFRRNSSEAADDGSGGNSRRRRRVVVRVAAVSAESSAEATSTTNEESSTTAAAASSSSSAAAATVVPPVTAPASAPIMKPVVELSRLSEGDLDAMWGNVARRAVETQHARVEQELSTSTDSAGAAAAGSSVAAASSQPKNDDADAEREFLINSQDRLCSALLMQAEAHVRDARRQVVDEEMQRRREEREERTQQQQRRMASRGRQGRGRPRRSVSHHDASYENDDWSQLASHQPQQQQQQSEQVLSGFALQEPKENPFRRQELSQVRASFQQNQQLRRGFAPTLARGAQAEPFSSKTDFPPSAPAVNLEPPPVCSIRSIPDASDAQQRHHQQQQQQRPVKGFPPLRRWSQPSFQPASFTTREEAMTAKRQQQEPRPHTVHNLSAPLQKRDPLDVLLDAVASSSGGGSGAIRRSSSAASQKRQMTRSDDDGGGWGVIPQEESSRRFASTSGGFRRIDAPRAASGGARRTSHVVLGPSSNHSAGIATGAAAAAASKPNTIISASSSTSTSDAASRSSPPPKKAALVPPQRRERFDETACLSMAIERVFSGVSRDSKTVPVSKCVEFFFDTSSSPSTAASSSSTSSTPAAAMTLGDIGDSFAACKRVQDVPVAVRREIRARMQRNHGGLLKFVEQKMQDKFSLQKDPVSSELIITISITAQQTEQQSKLRQQQMLRKQPLPAWAWNAANNNVTSFQLPSSAPVVVNDQQSAGGSFGDTGTAAASASVESRPWHQTATRQAVEQLRFSERLPLQEHEVYSVMDMFAAGARPIYGNDAWNFNVSLTGPRVWRSSEVAEAFVDHVPTFWVKEKQLAKALTMAMPDVLGEMNIDVEQMFERYSPQVFELHWGEPMDPNRNNGPFSSSSPSPSSSAGPGGGPMPNPSVPFYMLKNRDVRLSPFLVHPRRGAADAKWQLRASEFAAEESLHIQDRQFAEVLVENLPADGLFVHLPTWINNWARDQPQDFATINSAPPQRVLTVLHQYSSLFYIRADPPPRIQCVTDHFNTVAAQKQQEGQKRQDADKSKENIDIWVRRRPTHLAPRCIDEHDAETSPAPDLAQFLLETLIDHEDKVFAALSADSSSSPSSSTTATKKTSSQQQQEEQIVELPLPEHAPKRVRRSDQQEQQQQQQQPNEEGDDGAVDGVVKCVVAKFHGAGSSTPSSSSSSSSLAVWVPVPHIYRLLPRELKDQLKPFSTLAKFLRMHGRIFCVSQDLQRVALHRWDGASQAFATVDTLLAEEENAMNSPGASSPSSTAALDGGGGMEGVRPRTRKQLQHLAPDHPLLNPVKLIQAIVDALPADRSVLVKDVFHRLPREARAALPARAPYRVLLQAPQVLTVWKAHGPDGRKRHLMVQRADLGPPPPGCGLHDCATREEIVAHLQELLALNQRSHDAHENEDEAHHRDVVVDDTAFITLSKLHEQLRWDAVVGVRQHWGSLEAALKAYPQLFVVERDPINISSVNLSKIYLRK